MTQAEEALRKAAEEGDLATLKRLVEEGVDVNATNENGFTALACAALNGKLGCLEHLIAKGANLNTPCTGKWTALHYAAYFGHAPCVESLLKAGADASLKDDSGETALDEAKEKNHTEVIKLLENAPAVAAQVAEVEVVATNDKAATAKAAEEKAAAQKTAAAKAAVEKAAAEKAAAQKMAAAKAAADKAAEEKAAAEAAAKEQAVEKPAAEKVAAKEAASLGLLQSLEALSLDADTLRRVTAAAVAYCDAHGAASVADLVEYKLLDGLVASLALKSIPAMKLSNALKASPPSSDMAKLSVTVEPMPKVQIKPIAVSLLAADAPGITTEQSNDVQRVLQSLMDRPWPTWYPKVCISYATGTRKGTDARGAGPGMLQAATISHALYNAGIACASGLCVSAGNDWKDFLPKIDSRFARCEVLIVLLSPAFYLSHPCLLEAHKATRAKRMEIIPLRVAEPLPEKDDQWPNISEADGTLLDQVQDKLGALNALPPRGLFFDSPTYLDDLVGQVRGVLKRGPGEAGAHAGARHVA